MAGWLRAARDDLVKTRADRAGLFVLAAMILLFAVLAVMGENVGAFGLLLVAGGAVVWAPLVAADRSGRWRKPAAVAAVLLFPAWAALGVLSLWVPALEPLLGLSGDLDAGAGAFVRGVVTVGAILGLMRLFGPRGQRRGRG